MFHVIVTLSNSQTCIVCYVKLEYVGMAQLYTLKYCNMQITLDNYTAHHRLTDKVCVSGETGTRLLEHNRTRHTHTQSM